MLPHRLGLTRSVFQMAKFSSKPQRDNQIYNLEIAVKLRRGHPTKLLKFSKLGPRANAEVVIGAPPVNREANFELVSFIRRTCNLPSGTVEVVKGHKSRSKIVRILADSDPFDALEQLSQNGYPQFENNARR